MRRCHLLASALVAGISSLVTVSYAGAQVRQICPFQASPANSCLSEVDPAPIGTRVPVILIHGWNALGTSSLPDTWDPLIADFALDSSITSAVKLYTFTYNSNVVSVEELALQLTTEIRIFPPLDFSNGVPYARDFGGHQLLIVAHSMGGLIARSALVFLEADRQSQVRIPLLITLGTPHHGSPLANGPARDDKARKSAGQSWVALLNFIDSKLPPWSSVNRTDLFWDNFDALLDYSTFSNEQNDALVELNTYPISFDNRIIAYAGALGSACLNVTDALSSLWCLGKDILGGVFGMPSDGIVPVSSALLYDTSGQSRVRTRYLPDYSHFELAQGRGDGMLFSLIKRDLTDAIAIAANPMLGQVFVGDWTNIDGTTDSITRARFDFVGTTLFANMWGKCQATDCDWSQGNRPSGKSGATNLTGVSLGLSWTFDFGVKTQQVSLENGLLKVVTHTHFTDASGRMDYDSTDYFKRP